MVVDGVEACVVFSLGDVEPLGLVDAALAWRIGVDAVKRDSSMLEARDGSYVVNGLGEVLVLGEYERGIVCLVEREAHDIECHAYVDALLTWHLLDGGDVVGDSLYRRVAELACEYAYSAVTDMVELGAPPVVQEGVVCNLVDTGIEVDLS